MTTSPSPPVTQSPNQPPTNPYVGPRTFSAEQRHLFFGREREARDLLARVLSERFLLFYAQSGAGKSSLLHARLIPLLQEEKGFVVLPVGRVSGELPAGVAQVDNIFVYNLLLSVDEGSEPGQLAQVSLGDFLARLARRSVVDADGQERKGWVYDPALAPAAAGAPSGARRYALIVDQFEEIITSHPARWREREDFFRQVDAALAADPNLWVVLTLREDYVAALDPYAELCFNRLRARFYMERMDGAAALEAVRRPAELGGRPFAAGVAEQLVDNLRQVRVPGRETTVAGQYVEPVQLQVVCYQLWENLAARSPLFLRGRGAEGEGEITLEDLAVAGDVNQALTAFYEETLAAALADPAAAAVSERQVRAWFDEQLITEAGTRGLVHQGERESGGLPNGVVRALQRRFLVRGEARGGDVWIELVHDRFVEPIHQSNRAWFSRNLNPLTLDARTWREVGRLESKLYTGSQLSAAAAQIQASPGEFGEAERAFVEAGQQVETRRAARRQRAIAWGAGAIAVIFIALAVWALVSRGQMQVAQMRAVADKAIAQEYANLAATREAEAKVAEANARKAEATAEAARTSAENEKERADKEARTARSAQLALQAQFTSANLSAQSLLLAVEAVSIEGYAPMAESALFEAVRRASSNSLVFPSAAQKVQFSPDGRWLLAVGASGEALVWDVETPINPISLKDLKDEIPEKLITDALFSNDSQMLATMLADGNAEIWKMADLGAKPTPTPISSSIKSIAFSPDSQWLADATKEGYLELRPVDNVSTPSLVLSDIITDVTSLSISPDGSWLAATTDHNGAYLWSMAEDNTEHVVVGSRVALTGHTKPVTAIEFSRGGGWLATAAIDRSDASDETIRLWRLGFAPGQPPPSPDHVLQTDVSSFAFSNDGSQLAVGDFDGEVRIWSVENLDAEPVRLKCGSEIKRIVFSRDGEWLAASDEIGSAGFLLCLWRLPDPNVPVVFADHTAAINDIAFNDDGSLLASASDDGTVRLWYLDIISQTMPSRQLSSVVDWATISPDGRWLAASTRTGTVEILDPTNLNPLFSLAGHRGMVPALAFSPDSTLLATGDRVGTVRVWDLRTAPPSVTEYPGPGQIWSVVFSPDQRLLAVVGDSRREILDLSASTSTSFTLMHGNRPTMGVAFSPDGQFVATASHDAIRLWNAADFSGLPIEVLPTGAIWVAFSKDGGWLGAASNQVVLWKTGELIRAPIRLSGAEGSVNSFAFSPDGQRIASANRNGTVSMWNVKALKDQPIVVPAHAGALNSVEFSPDGSYLVTAGVDGMIRLWTVGTEEIIQIACRDARRNFTLEEWERFFGERPYERTCDEWPVHPTVYSDLLEQANALAQQGDVTGATAQLEEALALDPSLPLEPEVEAKRIYALMLVEEGRGLAQQGDVTGAVAKFEEALVLDPSLSLEPEVEAKRIVAHALVEQGRNLARHGDHNAAIAKFEDALILDPSSAEALLEGGVSLVKQGNVAGAVANFEKAQTLDPDIRISASAWNTLCWLGAIWSKAALVLDACETAVKLANNINTRDSRGLARALVGDAAGAIEDFEFAVRGAQEAGGETEFIRTRMSWIDALKAGENPFDEATLRLLRDE